MNEPALIQALRESNETAFRYLVDTYRNRIFSTVLNILHEADEAEDCTQEVFIQVYESISSFKSESSLSTWIYRIAVRKALDKLRRKKVRERIRNFLPWTHDTTGSQNFYHPGVTLDNKERAALLYKAIRSLPEKQQLAFTLIKVQKMRYDEASEIMDISTKAIESLVSRAKENLQKKLEHLVKK